MTQAIALWNTQPRRRYLWNADASVGPDGFRRSLEAIEGRLEGYNLGPNMPREDYERMWASSDEPDFVAELQRSLCVGIEFELLELAAGPVAEAAY